MKYYVYDEILRTKLPQICFADDAMFTIGGVTEIDIHYTAEQIIFNYISDIKNIILQVSAKKTEILFGKNSLRSEYIANQGVLINNDKIFPIETIKYLGVYIDKGFRFNYHIKQITDKAMRYERCLANLMLNIKGSSKLRKRLYAQIIFSVVLYAAPVCSCPVRNIRFLALV